MIVNQNCVPSRNRRPKTSRDGRATNSAGRELPLCRAESVLRARTATWNFLDRKPQQLAEDIVHIARTPTGMPSSRSYRPFDGQAQSCVDSTARVPTPARLAAQQPAGDSRLRDGALARIRAPIPMAEMFSDPCQEYREKLGRVSALRLD